MVGDLLLRLPLQVAEHEDIAILRRQAPHLLVEQLDALAGESE